jgi:hypothetical protein
VENNYVRCDVHVRYVFDTRCFAICIVENYVQCDVYVRYVFKNDTCGQDVSFVLSILAVSSCCWIECQFVFLRGPYMPQCVEMTRRCIVRGYIAWTCYDCMKFVLLLFGSVNKQDDKRIDLGV